MPKDKEQGEMSFLQHLEALRWHLVRAALVITVLAGVFFTYNEFVFGTIIFGPMKTDFLTYRALCLFSNKLGLDKALCIDTINFELINIDLSGQFTTHIWVSVTAAFILGAPYLLYEIWRFIKPALTTKERTYTGGVVLFASVLFLTGVLFSYYLVVPLTVNFLGSYQVTPLVRNAISMDSYISTITVLTFIMGIVFELPMIAYFLTKIGLLSASFMRKNRKLAIVLVLVVAAFITPSSDIPTLLLVSLPLYILYEASIFVSKYVERSASPAQ